MTISFRGAAKKLDDVDLPRIGSQVLGVGEDEVHAILAVESSGHGFDGLGRPTMLFEPHVFYRLLKGEERSRAVAEGLAYPKWGEKPYPKESYSRLERAIKINETAALEACSWGLGQVLGENHKLCGYATPQQMVADMAADEENQLLAMATFIKSSHLDDELREHRWEAFARGYNGPGYAKNNYHTRLPAAYKKWQGIRDTPFDRNAAAQETASNPPAAPTSVERPDVRQPVPTPAPIPAPAPSSPMPKAAAAVGILAAIAAFFHDNWPVMAVLAVIAVAVLVIALKFRKGGKS